MRSYLVFVVLLLMLGGLVYLLATRARPDHPMPAAVVVAEAPAPDAGPDAAASDAGPDADAAASDGSAVVARDGGAAAADGGAPTVLGRPLRVVGLDWEVLAPGLVANRGTAPGQGSRFREAGLDVRFSVAGQQVDLERALARGGADPAGADLAVLPLPRFVAASERLSALSPEVFLVVGWSKGREALTGAGADALTTLPANGEVQVAGEAGSTEAFLALFVLDLAGVSPSRVRFAAAEGGRVGLAAVSRGGGDGTSESGRSLLVSTADATRLIPYVVVAPHGLVASQAAALRVFAEGWLAGIGELGEDVPAAARHIGGLEGAPEALALLERLGQVETSSLRDNARAAGLAGRDPATLEVLYRHGHRLLREAGGLTSPPPDRAPISTAIVEALVRAGSALDEPAPPAPAGATDAAPAAGRPRVVLVWTEPEGESDEAELLTTIGFVASVFRPLAARVAVRGDRTRTREVVAAARERFDLPETRVLEGRPAAGRGPATVELLSGS